MGPAAVAEDKRERPAGRAATPRLRGSAAPLRPRLVVHVSGERARVRTRGFYASL